MGKSIFELYPKESFEHIKEQKLWKEYKEHFGEEIDELFGDNYIIKIRFGHFYREFIDGFYASALKSLRGYKENFVSEYDLNLYNKFEQLCLNTENMKKVKKGDWIKDDYNLYYLVIDGDIDDAIIKCGFTSNLKFINNQASDNHFTIDKTKLYCYKNVTNEELNKINLYFEKNKNSYSELIRFTDKFFEIRAKLFDKGFIESKCYLGNFYKHLTDETAFIINVKDYGKYIGIVYGFSSVSVYGEYKESLIKFGKDDDEITLREFIKINTLEDEENAMNIINEFYKKYFSLTKEELILCSKEKRKEFINCFKKLLKPYGFKKKSNLWSKDINDSLVFHFYLDKTLYSDSYHINSWINLKSKDNLICYSKRYLYQNVDRLNWQFINLDDLNDYINNVILKDIEVIINSSLKDLKENSNFIKHSFCNKKRCVNCFFTKDF